jgi:hypothetical protein
MLWKECHVMDERLRFVARLLEGEKIAGRPLQGLRPAAGNVQVDRRERRATRRVEVGCSGECSGVAVGL